MSVRLVTTAAYFCDRLCSGAELLGDLGDALSARYSMRAEPDSTDSPGDCAQAVTVGCRAPMSMS
jgi:hypothetical protein